MGRRVELAERLLAYVAGGAIVAMMLLTTADAAGRYLLNLPIGGAYEVTEKFLMVLTLLGVCHAYRNGSYVRLTFLVERLPRRLRLAVDYLAQTICVLISLLITVTTFVQTLRVLEARTIVDVRSRGVPLWPAYGVIPLAMVFLFLALFGDLKRVGRGSSHLFRQGEADV
ncbi:MAG: TRAP transporter small permease [Deltaproteobacteria bacterium]|nr:TRAP transporter small permease [Deltaproteobacteria bacterium]